MTEPTTAQRLKELCERLAGLEWAQAEPGPQWANDLVQRRIDQTRRKIARLSVIREALREPSEEMQNALIGAVRDGIAINDELAQRIAKETGAYYNQAQHALCVISEAGYDLVPRKLTMDMIVAGAEAVLIGGVPEEMSQRSYRAMIAASPIGEK